jgi:hypothetical protein
MISKGDLGKVNLVHGSYLQDWYQSDYSLKRGHVQGEYYRYEVGLIFWKHGTVLLLPKGGAVPSRSSFQGNMIG